MKLYFRIILLALTFYSCIGLHAQCTENLIQNGSFNSSVGVSVTAPGWLGTISPDVNDTSGLLYTSPCYTWTGTPLASNDGGTWQNLYNQETVRQNVSLQAGHPYLLCFEYAAQGVECPPLNFFNGPVGVQVMIDSTLHTITPDDSTAYTWESICINFTAQNALTTITFSPSQNQYVAIDGVCLTALKGTSVFEEKGLNEINISQRPGALEIRSLSGLPAGLSICLFELSGRKIVEKSFSGSCTISTDILTEGIYLYSLESDHNLIKRGKIHIR